MLRPQATFNTLITMPWNQSNGERDPWRPGAGAGGGPPDLFELFRKTFGGRGGGGGKISSLNVGLIVALVVAIWLFSGIYIVSEGQRGVELRFGAYSETTLPGPHWHIPYPIETVEEVDIDRIRSATNKSPMLTQDENIVEVELAVQYRVKDASDYLFNVRLPDVGEDFRDQSVGTLFQVMESALREVVGKSRMDFVLGEGRAEIAARIKLLMQQVLDQYRSGLEVVTVNLQQSQPPEAVQGAFADAIKAREDEIRFINEAEAYSNGIIPQARGEAARMMQEATAYRERVTANSEGEAQRFLKLYGEYRKAPEVTRKRLYLQAMQSVLSRSNKVMVDVKGSNNIFYLPLDRLMKGAAGMPGAPEAGVAGAAAGAASGTGQQQSMRERATSQARRALRGVGEDRNGR